MLQNKFRFRLIHTAVYQDHSMVALFFEIGVVLFKRDVWPLKMLGELILDRMIFIENSVVAFFLSSGRNMIHSSSFFAKHFCPAIFVEN